RAAIGDVDRIAARGATAALDLARRLDGAFAIQVQHDQLAALCGESQAILPPQAARAAGDQRDPALDAEVHESPDRGRSSPAILAALELGGARGEEPPGALACLPGPARPGGSAELRPPSPSRP